MKPTTGVMSLVIATVVAVLTCDVPIVAGGGRLFDRVETGATRMWESDGGAGDGAARAGTATRDSLGYEQERGQLAKKVGVDPYTSNPILAKKLDEIAWVAFAGRLSVNTAISVAVPGWMLITGIKTTDDLVWDTPRGDLVVEVEKKLEAMKVAREQVSAFTHNAAIPLSLQLAAVESLGRLGDVPGRAGVVAMMAGAASESQTRFLATSLRMLADHHQKRKAITAIAAHGPLVGRDADGVLVVPAPVDYLSWTERIAAFATNPDFLAVPKRTLWLRGKMSARARKEFEANGWTIDERAA